MSYEWNGRSMPDFKQAGVGLQTTRKCMGCNLSRNTLGSSGVGIRWRCAHCLADRAAKLAAKEVAMQQCVTVE